MSHEMQRADQGGREPGRIQNNERRLKFSKNNHPHKVKEFHVYDIIECFAKELSKQKKEILEIRRSILAKMEKSIYD